MEGRTTVYNNIVSEEDLSKVNHKNIDLMKDFLEYLSSINRSQTTIDAYRHDLQIFFVWNVKNNDNVYFVDLTKRQIAKFQNYGLNELNWSSNRLRRVKSTLSSLSNYIENILDDEIENYKPIIRKIENPAKEAVRKKTILTDKQIDTLLDLLVEEKKYQQACAVALAVYSGSRKTELTRFKVSYFDDCNIVSGASLYRTPEQIRTKGRGGKMGKLLTKYTLLDFKKYFDLWMDERKKEGIESEWLFVTKDKDGNYIRANARLMDSYAQTCTRLLNVPFYFHCCRHALCTKLCKYNLPASVIQEYFGWSSQDLISVYDDTDASEDFGKYFTSEGIQQQEKGEL